MYWIITQQIYFWIIIPVDDPLGGVTNRIVASLLKEPSSMLTHIETCAIGPSVTEYITSAKATCITKVWCSIYNEIKLIIQQVNISQDCHKLTVRYININAY